MFVHRPLLDRFWEKVDKSGDCWLWTGVRHHGYGSIWSGAPLRRGLKTHRLSWEIANGPIPPGVCVLHRCDNPPCVNPAHLFLGTHKDNADDRERKGRGPREKDSSAISGGRPQSQGQANPISSSRNKNEVSQYHTDGSRSGIRSMSAHDISHSWRCADTGLDIYRGRQIKIAMEEPEVDGFAGS